ncbi:hypothetical protein D7316_01882 [Gordonia insulae]|uniref:Lipoprotein n=2 Tax=Gordonia insulae TaxID=2420509 RepID=A0A3G8JJM5_9ACTN|nr:hypothetical protein D7316_01882 [Gordonia insulae]
MVSCTPRRVLLLACLLAAPTMAGCASASSPDGETPTSVPTSAAVTVPAGVSVRSAPGTTLLFGESAVLPADAFAATGSRAMFTVTGITPAEGVPDDVTDGGVAYFLYVTVTSLSPRSAPAPGVVGLSGTADGRTPTLTLSPTPGLAKCPITTPPERMRRGESYSTCLVSVADEGQRLRQVIYWADTTGDPAFDYQATPVVWSSTTPAPPSGSAPPPTG